MMIIVSLLLLSIATPVFCASCGSSSIPYSFETLPSGGTVLGCARPSCFGYSPDGMALPSTSSFTQFEGGQYDGFERESPALIQNYQMSNSPQTADCEESFGSTSCDGDDQWVGGVIPNFSSTQSGNSLQCCSYEPLRSSSNRGIATVGAGQIVIGGEVYENGQQVAFDFINNVETSSNENGNTVYLVHIRRFSCPMQALPPVEPIQIPPQQPPQFILQVPQYPIQPVAYYSPAQSYYCFTGDMMVELKEGSRKRMDEIEVGDFVKIIGEHGPQYSRVDFWIHRVPDQVAEFRKIILEDGSSLKLTDYHKIYKTSCTESKFVRMEHVVKSAVSAIEVEVGDCLYKIENNGLKVVKVSKIINVFDTGIYSPMTGSGTILVNSYHSSCLTVMDNYEIQFSFFKTFAEVSQKLSYIFGGYDQENALTGASTIVEILEFIMPRKLFFK